jgi:hypothetical protein
MSPGGDVPQNVCDGRHTMRLAGWRPLFYTIFRWSAGLVRRPSGSMAAVEAAPLPWRCCNEADRLGPAVCAFPSTQRRKCSLLPSHSPICRSHSQRRSALRGCPEIFLARCSNNRRLPECPTPIKRALWSLGRVWQRSGPLPRSTDFRTASQSARLPSRNTRADPKQPGFLLTQE